MARRFPEWRCDRCRMQDWQPCSMYIVPKVRMLHKSYGNPVSHECDGMRSHIIVLILNVSCRIVLRICAVSCVAMLTARCSRSVDLTSTPGCSPLFELVQIHMSWAPTQMPSAGNRGRRATYPAAVLMTRTVVNNEAMRSSQPAMTVPCLYNEQGIFCMSRPRMC